MLECGVIIEQFAVLTTTNIQYREKDCKIVIQVNGKKRGIIEMPINSKENTIIEKSKKVDNVLKHLEGQKIVKNIYIKNKLINFIIKK